MAEESDLERTEPASSRRIEKAREEGQVPRSRELMAFLVLLAGGGGLWAMSGWVSHRSQALLRHGLTFGREEAFSNDAVLNNLAVLTRDAFLVAAPIFALTMVAAIVAPILTGGWIFSTKALVLDFGRINPITGIKRVISMQGLGELVKAVLKSLLIGGLVFWMIFRDGEAMLALLNQPLDRSIDAFFKLIFSGVFALLLGVALIAAIDVPFQLWQYYSRLRMTREEVRQENKEMEGDPQLKARIRSQQREVARRRMMAQVPKADVVVTNPTRFAVALQYDAEHMSAPKVVAKGTELIAQRIREIAEENDIPIIEAPPLARALHRHAELDRLVPAGLYVAVAEVMAYVYQLSQYMADGGRNAVRPQPPANIEVPTGLDPGLTT